MDKNLEVYSGLPKLKGNGVQYTALCPYHNDNNASLSINMPEGVHNCKACGIKGNTFTIAKYLGMHNPEQYLTNKNGNGTSYKPKPKYQHTPQSLNELESKMRVYQQNLKDNWKDFKFKDIWRKELIDDLEFGLDDDNQLWFSQHNKEGKIIAIQKHKGIHLGDGSCKWYLRHKIPSYKRDKPLIICEGSQDAISLYNYSNQVTTSTTGCQSIPRDDWGWIKNWKSYIFICYDRDKAGLIGAKKLAKELHTKFPHLKIHICKWGNLSKGFDATDSYLKDGGKELSDAIAHSERYISETEEKQESLGGFKVYNIEDFMNQKYASTQAVVKSMFYKNQVFFQKINHLK